MAQPPECRGEAACPRADTTGSHRSFRIRDRRDPAVRKPFGPTARGGLQPRTITVELPQGAVLPAPLIDGHLNRASDATRLADRLCDLGLIERLSSTADRRVVLVRITDAGRDVFARLTRRIQDLHREQWQALGKAELETLNRLLTKVLWGDDAKSGAAHPLVKGSDR